METHYQAPSTISPLGLVLGGLAVLAGGLLLAPLYSYAIVYIDFFYINVFLGPIFGLCLGGMISFALRAGHTHHKGLSYAVVVVGLLFAYWMHWLWWFSGLAFRADLEEFSMVSLFLPGTLSESVVEAYHSGTWSDRSGNVVSGLGLGLWWFLEALLFFCLGLLGATTAVGSGTYCSRCKAWCTILPSTRLLADPTGDISHQVDHKNWAALLRPPPDGSNTWHEVEVHRCDGCGETNTVTVRNITIVRGRYGRNDRQVKVLVDRVYISGADLNTLLNSWNTEVLSSEDRVAR